MYLESNLQQNCVKWFKCQYPNEVIFSIPNEGIRSKSNASRMKAEGMRSGVADLQIIAKDKMPLFIEMKYGKNKQTSNQIEFESQIKSKGCFYFVCNSIESFISITNKYLSK